MKFSSFMFIVYATTVVKGKDLLQRMLQNGWYNTSGNDVTLNYQPSTVKKTFLLKKITCCWRLNFDCQNMGLSSSLLNSWSGSGLTGRAASSGDRLGLRQNMMLGWDTCDLNQCLEDFKNYICFFLSTKRYVFQISTC